MVSRTSVHDCLHDNDASTLTATGSVAESERGLERGKRRGEEGTSFCRMRAFVSGLIFLGLFLGDVEPCLRRRGRRIEGIAIFCAW